MTHPHVLTSVVLVVPADRAGEVPAAYRELITEAAKPDGLLRSELLRAQDGRWLVQTLWRDLDAIVAARASGVRPAALALAERLGADHSHDVLTVEGAFERQQ